MAVLAIPEAVEASLGRSLSAEEAARADALLLLASSAVEEETRRRFAPGSYTVGRKVTDGVVTIPAHPATIVAVRAINTSTGAATTITAGQYTTRGRKVYLSGGLGFTGGPYFVEVDFTVTDDVPADVAGVVAGIVASTISGPPVGASAQSAGTYSISYVASSGKVWLSASDRAILNKYRTPRLALDLL